jgi:8-oxo-dGTP diphosphatase
MSYTYEHPRPALTVDIVLFANIIDALSILLIQRKHPPFKGMWALPGGFVDMDETLEQAAIRELEEETGVSGAALEQFYVFDAIDRDPRQRIISVVFVSVVNAEPGIKAGDDASEAKWFNILELPNLAFDHAEIIKKALEKNFSGSH